jgi:2-polyprenyl-3-methyl-5-hydroxy-6-metoxy-1,4-benzoquinol methylase
MKKKQTEDKLLINKQIRSKYEYILNLLENSKNVLIIGNLSDAEIKLLENKKYNLIFYEKNFKTNCSNNKIEDGKDEAYLKSIMDKKFDVVILCNYLEFQVHPNKILKQCKEFLHSNGYIICSIPNISHINYRLEILNGDFTYQTNNENIEKPIQMFTLDKILVMMEQTGFYINKLFRDNEKIDYQNSTLKEYSIPEEIIESIMRDPESMCKNYIFKAFNISKNNKPIKKYMTEFSKNIVTDRLQQILHYYKKNLIGQLEKTIQEKDFQISNLQINDKFKQKVNKTYQNILMRSADSEGLEHFGTMLENKKITEEELVKILYESDEYKSLKKQL